MVSELRWPSDPCPDTGIDVRSLELDPGDLAVLDILRRPDVMTHLAQWNAGTALGEDTRRRVTASSAVAVISVPGRHVDRLRSRRISCRGGMDYRTAARAGCPADIASLPVRLRCRRFQPNCRRPSADELARAAKGVSSAFRHAGRRFGCACAAAGFRRTGFRPKSSQSRPCRCAVAPTRATVWECPVRWMIWSRRRPPS